MLYSILVSVDVLIAAALIGLVLMQQGKGAGMGAAFGAGGGSGSVFGARGSGSFLTRATAILAALFFINSIVLAYIASNRAVDQSVIDSQVVQEQPAIDIPASAPDIPGVINIPEGATGEQMMDLVKDAIEKQSDEISGETPSDIPKTDISEDTINEVIDESSEVINDATDKSSQLIKEVEETTQQIGAENALPADIPQ